MTAATASALREAIDFFLEAFGSSSSVDSTIHAPMSCSKCLELDAALEILERCLATEPECSFQGPWDFSIGSVLELTSQASRCDSCRSILKTIYSKESTRRFDNVSPAITAHLSTSNPRMFILVGDIAGVPPTDFRTRRARLHDLSYTPCYSTNRVKRNESRGRVCDPTLIDVELVRKWIHRCDTTHQRSCTRQYDLQLLPTATLSFIDIENQCIATPASEVRYVALSYVWGTKSVVRALKSNIADLRRQWAFVSDQYQLPRTVKDAIALCSYLDIRYLWVDSVCIVQDDPELQREQLLAMAAVYGKAYFTIAAVQPEHAHAGIARVGHADGACSSQDVIRLPSRSMTVAKTPAAFGLSAFAGSKWNTRGWTLQEHVFSKRLLILNTLATWSCYGHQWTEDVESASEIETESAQTSAENTYKLGPVTWPSIRAYGDLAMNYATRDLTYDSDAINAFSGILTPMNGWFTKGLLHGISEFTFDAGLLWNPRREGARLRQRFNYAALQGGSFMFPTWSWISWKGNIQFDLWNTSEDYVYPRGPLLLKPLVAWEKRLIATGEWMKVDNTYHVVRAHFSTDKNPPPPIPEGWTRYQDESDTSIYYQHKDHAHILPWPRFSYPIPPFARNRDMDRRECYPYLKFRGKLARLALGIPLDQRNKLEAKLRQGGHTSEVDLMASQGSWSGRLRLNLQRGEAVPSECAVVDVIAISEGVLDLRTDAYARYIFGETSNRKELAGLDVYEIVNVLWITWCGEGLAYRQALGRVWKQAWNQLETTETELLLT
ncbi:Heterokaryon incompatibility protein [Paramyrothecium foliicola]|nr:Heterokaryon incompatibility protein [Paramyrothecium foliicola]